MEWPQIVDSGVAVAGFIAFLRLVFVDLAEIKSSMQRLEEVIREQNRLLVKLVSQKGVEEVKDA